MIPLALVEVLQKARSVVVLTGAGVSAESNIPTFRDAMTGLWAQYRPEELATPEAFARNPKLVWDWYQWRRDLVSGAKPNPGHEAIVTMGERFPEFTLITQNVDSLHQRAGSREVVELHGNIARTLCSRERIVIDTFEASEQTPPPCPHCGAPLRPDVVWFGEGLPEQALRTALVRAGSCDVFFSVGTSALVQPAASLIYSAMQHGAKTVEVNPGTTPQSQDVDFQLCGPSGEILPALMAALD